MNLSRAKQVFYIFTGIFLIGFLLRIYGLTGKSFKTCDEGYHLIYPLVYEMGAQGVFYFKHGMMMWIYWWLNLFSFTPEGALLFNSLCGIATMPLFYLLCRQFLNVRAALFAFFAFASSYYIIYYHRTFLSDGFGLFFFTGILLLIIITFRLFGVIRCTPGLRPFRKFRYPVLLFTAVLLGFSFTVRIQTCLTLCGCIGAFFAAFLLRYYIFRKRRMAFSFRKYFLVSTGLVLVGAFFYWIFIFHIIKDAVHWGSTFEWYGKNLVIASGKNAQAWKPFMIIFLLKFCSLSFLAGGFTGLFLELFRVKSLNFVRLVVFISAAGLGCMYFYLRMPWPRAYLYFVCFLCVYWGIFSDFLLSRAVVSARRWAAPAIAALLILSLSVGEFALLKHMFTMDSNYNNAVRWMEKNGKDCKFSATHAWPIILLARPQVGQVSIIYGNQNSSYDEFLRVRLGNYLNKNIRFIVLDSYASYFRTNHEFLERLYSECEPAAEFRNDYGLDEHTSYDTFATGPVDDVFIDKIVIFDMENLKRRLTPLKMEKK